MATILHDKPVRTRNGKLSGRKETSPKPKRRPVGTTRLSIKGQVVIPEAICHKIGLKRGDQFLVLADKDTICLRLLHPPTSREWSQLQELANLLTAEIPSAA